jgi:acyl carrier protein
MMIQEAVMTNREINQKFRQFIVEHFPIRRQQVLAGQPSLAGQQAPADQPLLADDESLLKSNIIDSMGMLELVTFIETEFQVTVEGEELLPENFESIAALSGFVASKLMSH